jgi:WD40 repeat protein
MPRQASVVSTDFNQKREKAIYRNYGQTFIVRNAHSESINCLCYLINGTFMTGSSDKFIRVWPLLDNKPIGMLEEDYPINLMLRIGKTSTNDVTSIYVAEKVIRYLSIKNQKAIFLYKDNFEITAIARINSSPDNHPIISIGTSNGMIKDYDLKNK